MTSFMISQFRAEATRRYYLAPLVSVMLGGGIILVFLISCGLRAGSRLTPRTQFFARISCELSFVYACIWSDEFDEILAESALSSHHNYYVLSLT